MTKRKNPSDKPKRHMEPFAKKKPDELCKHDWYLVDTSAVPLCKRCKGYAQPGQWLYTAAYQQAMMRMCSAN